MAGKEKEPHSWRLLPEQVFIGPNSNIFTPEGSIRFGIYVRAKAIESLPNDSSSREQLTQEMSEEYYKLYSSKKYLKLPLSHIHVLDGIQFTLTVIKIASFGTP